jgi:FAD/FMN-containing dehydrogenase
MSRRKVLAGAAGVAALTLLPAGRVYAATGQATIETPPNFPTTIPLYQQTYQNWAKEIIVPNVWTCSPASPQDVVTLANWARANGFRLRPVGSRHGFAPFILKEGSDGNQTLLVNTMDHLTNISVRKNGSRGTATAQAGATIEHIAEAADPQGLGFRNVPAPGGVTIAGALAMNAHGNSLPVGGERLLPGHSWGTLSNLVQSLTAVVWDSKRRSYVLQTFSRDDKEIGPLLTSLARSFVTEVTLQMGPLLKMRCHSRVDISTADMCAPPESAGPNSYAALVEANGSVEVLWDVFTQGTWAKTWEVAPTKPASSREVTTPYNYPTDVPEAQADAITAMLQSQPYLAPYFSQQSAAGIQQLFTPQPGDSSYQMYDLWGPSYCTQMYVKPDTIRLTVAAWGVLLKRSDLQRAVSEFYAYFSQKIGGLAQIGQFPFAGNVDWRAQGLDNTDDVVDCHATEPYLSGARPVPKKREYDTILWFALNSNVGMPGAAQFYTDVEDWFLSNYSSYAIVRPEWTKAYGFSSAGGWSDTNKLQHTYPDTYRRSYGYPASNDWDRAVSDLTSYDPAGVFSNPYLDTLMG